MFPAADVSAAYWCTPPREGCDSHLGVTCPQSILEERAAAARIRDSFFLSFFFRLFQSEAQTLHRDPTAIMFLAIRAVA